jgi:hypothetical protein
MSPGPIVVENIMTGNQKSDIPTFEIHDPPGGNFPLIFGFSADLRRPSASAFPVHEPEVFKMCYKLTVTGTDLLPAISAGLIRAAELSLAEVRMAAGRVTANLSGVDINEGSAIDDQQRTGTDSP